MAIDLAPLLFLEGLAILCLISLITWLIVFVNDNLTRLGAYHVLKTKFCSNGESFYLKVLKVFLIYIGLFLPVYFSIYVSLKFIQVVDVKLATQGIIELSPLFTIVFLILMRLLMNPTLIDVETLLKLKTRDQDFEKIKKAAETFKERVLSFFSSYISLTLIIFFFYMLIQFYIITHNPSDASSAMNTIISTESIPDNESISSMIVTYLGLLVFFTFFTEFQLWAGTPIIQTEWKRVNKQKTLGIETFETFGLSKKDKLRYHFNHKLIIPVRNMPSKLRSFLDLKLGNYIRRCRRS
jgi:hypothetical protein